MTGESKEKTEPWVEKHKLQYDFGYMTKEAMSPWMKSLGMRGYPSAALVNPKGVVVWTGHPASLSGSVIKKHLKGASKTPVDIGAVVRNWPKEAMHARSAFASGNLGKALAEAKKLPEEWSVAGDVERVIKKHVTRLNSLNAAGDVLGFTTGMKAANKSLAGLPELTDLQTQLKELLSGGTAKSVLSGQKKLAKLAAGIPELRKSKDAVALSKKIRKLAAKHPNTIVSETANKLVSKIENARTRMR
ncbi:MAG: hypothetical protein ACI89X_003448 [Planctomycetota bacterium]